MGWIIAVFGLIIVGLTVYIYSILKRALATFLPRADRKRVKIITACVSIGIGLLCANPMWMSAIVILHVLGIYAIFQLFNCILAKTVGKKHALSTWKKVYASGVLPILLTAVILIIGHFNLNNVIQTKYTVYTEKDIRSEGYRIVLIADVHYGVSLHEDELLEKCKEISETKPDIVILGGDIVDNSTSFSQMHTVFAALGGIESKMGIYYIHGNHDRPMSMVKSEYTEEDLVETILTNGITILQDDVLALTEDLTIVGREDRSAKSRLSLSELFERVDQSDFVLTLDHQPNQYAQNGKMGTDLLLSGHTHGGQLFPINYVQELIPFNDGVYGRYSLEGGGTAIVTAGFATWNYPSKTAAPAEYVIIDVVKQ